MLKFILVSILCIRSLSAGDFIPHSVGVLISPKGYQQIADHIEPLMYYNGFSPDSFALEEQTLKTQEGPLEEIISTEEEEVYQLIQTWREYLQRILIGIRLDKHQFSLNASQLEANLKWEDITLDFSPANETIKSGVSGIVMTLSARTKEISLAIGKVVGKDLINPTLGEAGFSNLIIGNNKESDPLHLSVKVHFQKDKGNFKAKVFPIEWNWNDIDLIASYDRPLIFRQYKFSSTITLLILI